MKRPAVPPRGFSLVELLVTMGLLILILGSMYSIFAFNQKTFSVQDQVLALNQNILGCTEVIGREARSAGLKVALSGGTLGAVAQMIPSGFLPANPAPVPVSLSAGDYPVKITQGSGTNPDAVTIIGALGEGTNPTKLTTAAGSGSTTITLNLGGSETAALYTVGDVIYVGEDFENAKVMAVTGSQLTIDTNPAVSGNQGLIKNHGQWSEVGKISVISYELFTSASPPVLMRKENSGPFVSVAADITNLQAVPNGNRTNLTLTARTAAPDSDYGTNSGYRQKIFNVSVAPKNIK
ncbi:MAG: prepilin-type N-terminal cleavage/methylation domain-containing protein [Deltaproteobacteria bacterium]|nr:prepilin-type N-terminal cleavage/methylation domain-containing protein [Deltaproteobacteria bacterium]